MTYELKFERRAKKEWDKLGHPVREQFKKSWLNVSKTHISLQRGFMDVLIATK